MAASGCVEAKGSAGELNNLLAAQTLLENGVFERAFHFEPGARAPKDRCWARRFGADDDIVNLLQSPAPLTLRGAAADTRKPSAVFLCQRRTLRIERAPSTESVVATSSGESCQSSSIASDSASEPSSPSRPVTPPPMPPVPAHLADHCRFECLRPDSEDSGLGPSPAKCSMGPTSPLQGFVSPIQFVPEAEDEEEDEVRPSALLDLTPCRAKSGGFLACKEDGFLPYAVSQLISQEVEEEVLDDLCQRPGGGFRFCLPRGKAAQCGDRSSPDIGGLEQSALDFQFLMTSKSSSGEGAAEPDARKPAPADAPCSPELLPSSPAGSSSSRDKADGPSFDSPPTKVDLNAKYSSSSHLSPRHKVPPLGDDLKSDCISSARQGFAAGDSAKLEGDESRQSSCGDRSEICHELASDCTSSSCSQVTNDAQSGGSAPDNTCKWLNCDQVASAANSSDLIDHLRRCHVQSQFEDGRSYVCLWVGCKVYDRPSSSRSWLERHVLLHGGSKPFRCIVDGCHQRFGTEGALQRHVNSHFPQRHGKAGPHGESQAGGSGPGGATNGRLLKRKKHHKFRRRPHSVKTNDFFDDGIMEQVRHSLLELSSIEGMDRAGPPAAITFHSTVIARRTEGSGKTKLLLHWDPEDLIPDCWVPEEDAPSSFQKTIPIASLPPDTLVHLDPLYAARLLPRPGKRRRK